MQITVKHYETEMEIKTPDDGTIPDLMYVFNAIVIGCGYAQSSWEDEIIELANIYRMKND